MEELIEVLREGESVIEWYIVPNDSWMIENDNY